MHIMMGRPKEARVNADVSLEIAKSKRDMLSEMYARGLLVQICLQEKDVKSAKENLKDVQDFGGVSSAATAEDLALSSGLHAVVTLESSDADAQALKRQVSKAYIAPDPLTIKTHIIAMVKNMVGGGDEVDGDTPLMESGVDSLASVELRTQLQGVGNDTLVSEWSFFAL
ncbi:ftsH [Symbiodinium sp. CCMP2592]|nr:ftsH [Symbiodinium sp. CCMP2592]